MSARPVPTKPTVQFAGGAPIWIPGIGMIPGPIARLHLGDRVYVVDDRHPGEDLIVGDVLMGRTVTHAEAVALWLGPDPTEDSIPTPPGAAAPTAPPAPGAWLTTEQAAERLNVRRGELDAVAEAAAASLPEAVIRVGQGTVRRTYRWNPDRLSEAVALARAQDATTSTSPTLGAKPSRGAKGSGGAKGSSGAKPGRKSLRSIEREK